MKSNDAAKERVDQLIKKGQNALSQIEHTQGIAYVKEGPLKGWVTQALSFISDILGQESDYYCGFQKCFEKYRFPSNVDAGIKILESLKEDIGNGYIGEIEATISANIFGDFLEMADYFLSEHYKDPAASICGAALETGLRKILYLRGLSPKESDRLQSLNEQCLKADIYKKLTYGEVKVWKDIRDHAAHGEYTEYDEHQVRNMIDGTRRLLGEYLEA